MLNVLDGSDAPIHPPVPLLTKTNIRDILRIQTTQRRFTLPEPTQNTGVSPGARPIITPSVPGVRITSTEDILRPETRLCQLIWGPSGYGKTNFAGGLDALTQKYEGKRTLYIAVEAGEGGGAATIRHLSIPMYVPKDYTDMYKVLGLLRNDKSIGGIVFDSATEFNQAYIKPAALKYPCRENVATRGVGVPTRSDFQTMGEMMSGVLRLLMGMTTHEDPNYRKHLIVTAADMVREEDEKIVYVGPALPGRMAKEATQMFNQVGEISIKPQVVDGKRVNLRVLNFETDGVRAKKDRYKIYPGDMQLKQLASDKTGEDVLSIYERYWLPIANRC